MLTLGSKLNRLYQLHLPFMDDFCEITVLFNKSNSFIGFNVDQQHYIKSRNNDIKCFIFNDLSKSAFAVSFLDIRNFRSRNLDIMNQFNNILPEFKDKIHYESNETIKLSKINIPNGKLESCLYIYIFRMTDFNNNFLYCLIERQHIDVALDKKIVRTSAIQLSSNECYEDLTLMIESTNRKIIHNDTVESIKNVFSDKKDVRDLN